MAIGYGNPQPKAESRTRTKARVKRQSAKQVADIRARVVKRSNRCCERCYLWIGHHGHAHHRIPRSRGGKWTMENIEYLCAACHQHAHLTNAL